MKALDPKFLKDSHVTKWSHVCNQPDGTDSGSFFFLELLLILILIYVVFFSSSFTLLLSLFCAFCLAYPKKKRLNLDDFKE